jgi:putative transposase
MVAYIDAQKSAYGVGPICEMLPIAPSTYYDVKAKEREPGRRCARAIRDESLQGEIQRVWSENFWVYGVRKVWRQLNREDISVARCTVGRLMKTLDLRGVVRGRRIKTTLPSGLAERPLDLVNRNFKATRPNALWFADLSYVATWRGFVYVAFVIDAFARRIVGWRVSTSLRIDLALVRVRTSVARASHWRRRPAYPS